MTFYLFFTILLLGCFLLSRIQNTGAKTFGTYIPFYLTLVLVSIRFDVGFDYVAYYRLVSENSILAIQKMEWTTQQIVALSKWFGHPQFFFIIYAIPTYFFCYYTLKKYSSDFLIGFIVFFSLFFFMTVGPIRQALALSITFFGYKFIREKSIVKYLIICLIAALFHATALIAIPIYFIYNRLSILNVIILATILFLLKYTLLLVLTEIGYGLYYITNIENQSGGSLNIIFYFLLIASFYILYRYRKLKYKEEVYNLFKVVLVGLVFPFILGTQTGLRISNYFFIYLTLLIPIILSQYRLKLKIMVMVSLLTYFTLLLWMSTSIKEKSPFTPYQCILFIDTPFFK